MMLTIYRMRMRKREMEAFQIGWGIRIAFKRDRLLGSFSRLPKMWIKKLLIKMICCSIKILSKVCRGKRKRPMIIIITLSSHTRSSQMYLKCHKMCMNSKTKGFLSNRHQTKQIQTSSSRIDREYCPIKYWASSRHNKIILKSSYQWVKTSRRLRENSIAICPESTIEEHITQEHKAASKWSPNIQTTLRSPRSSSEL